MSHHFKFLGLSELLPRYIFAESLFARRRVLEVGAVASTEGQSAQFLLGRGARVVVAADDDLVAVQTAQAKLGDANLRFRPTLFEDVESGSFDVVLVADLSRYVRAPELMRELARLVAPSGHLLGGLRNPAGLALAQVLEAEEGDASVTYGQLLDVLSTSFASVEVATQSPVLGYQLAQERGEGLQVDGTLVGASEAAYFVVLAGQEPVRELEPTWVQLKPEPLLLTSARLADASQRAKEWRQRSEKLKELVEKKGAEFDREQSRAKEIDAQLAGAQSVIARLTAQLEMTQEPAQKSKERDEFAQRVRQLESHADILRERALDADARTKVALDELEALKRQRHEALNEANLAHEATRLELARREELGVQLEDGRARLARTNEELTQTQSLLAQERLEYERLKLALDRASNESRTKDRQLREAHEREIALAESKSEALQAFERLRENLAQVREQLAQAQRQQEGRDYARAAAERSVEVERRARAALEGELEGERARKDEALRQLADGAVTIQGLETELEAARASVARGLVELQAAQGAEQRWKQTANDYQARAHDAESRAEQAMRELESAKAALRVAQAELEVKQVLLAEKEAALVAAERLSVMAPQAAAERDAALEELQARECELEQKDAALNEVTLRFERVELERLMLEKSQRALQAEAQLAGDRASSLEQQLAQLRQELRSQENAAALAEERSENASAFLREELERARQAAAAAREALQRADELATQRTQQLADVEARLADERQRCSQATQRAQDLVAIRESLEARCQALEAECASVSKKSAEASDTLSQMQTQIESREAEFAEVRQTTEQQLVQLLDELNRLQHEVAAKGDALRRADELTMQLRGQLEQAEAQLVTAQQRVVEANKHAEDLAAERDTLASRVSEAEHWRQSQQASVDGLAQELEAKRHQLIDAQAALLRAQSEARGHQAAKLGLQQQLEVTRSALAEANRRAEALQPPPSETWKEIEGQPVEVGDVELAFGPVEELTVDTEEPPKPSPG